MLLLVLSLFVLWALTAPHLGPLKFYLRANFCYLLILSLFVFFHGTESHLYAIFYTAFTIIMLAMAAWMSWFYVRILPRHEYICIAGLACGAFVGILTHSGLQFGSTLGKAINTLEGATMVALAFVMGMCWIRFIPADKRVALITGTMFCYWLLIGAFRLGWTLHEGAFWEKLNWFVPPFLTAVTWAWMGWRLRPSRSRLPLRLERL